MELSQDLIIQLTNNPINKTEVDHEVICTLCKYLSAIMFITNTETNSGIQ